MTYPPPPPHDQPPTGSGPGYYPPAPSDPAFHTGPVPTGSASLGSGQNGAAPYGDPGGAPHADTAAHTSDGTSDPGFLRALFDLKFEHFITIRFASVIYVIAMVIAVLTWVSAIIASIMMGFAMGYDIWSGGSSFNPAPVLITIFLGWIPMVVQILLSRIIIEFFAATIRTAQNTTKLAHRR
ncbi:DUF4282 domain-containing protein [Brevibacterium sp. NPDC049920]|uniref:DUF4282 domain-containing protein n=1 Tax=Brevibacterium pityocampae TaxID=506594 RepID=A0ABP8JTH6_9MICO